MMSKNCRQGPAPSIVAASNGERGRLISPASMISVTNGVHCQTSMAMIVGITRLGDEKTALDCDSKPILRM